MMLMTPAIASEPYSDEAPSVRISMRSTMLAGIVLRSTAAETPDADDSLTQRRPSTSTSVRLAPRLRSEIVVEPEPTPPPSGGKPKLPAELNLVLSDEPLTDSCWMHVADRAETGRLDVLRGDRQHRRLAFDLGLLDARAGDFDRLSFWMSSPPRPARTQAPHTSPTTTAPASNGMREAPGSDRVTS